MTTAHHQRLPRAGAWHRRLLVVVLATALLGFACSKSDDTATDAVDAVAPITFIPPNVDDTCPVAAATFDSWFQSGAPSADGVVTAANSVGFPTTNTACDFYSWGARMFLWLTSPDGDGLVLDGPSIFTVSPADANGNRALIANTDDAPVNLALRVEKTDDIGEVGQAGGGGVLLSQANSLVYYGVHVNDVYGYFLTGQKGNALPNATTFPRNQDDLDAILSYVATNFPDVTIDNPDALSMELKTSWVDASTVPDPEQFVTIEAEVPVYTETSETMWSTGPGETTVKTLALVGMHVVGTVQNHPEFVWITYEHVANAPFGNYYYTDTNGSVVEQAFDSSGDYQFMATNGTEAGSNTECATASGTAITATNKCDGGIVPSDTYSSYPWGSKAGDNSAAAVANNTLLLSLNNSVMGQLSSGDVRQNYIQTGGIWTSAPSASGDAPIPDHSGFDPSDLRGSLFAFNTTMETYHQGLSCFSCHAVSKDSEDSFGAFELSHIYSQITPLEPSK